jgi:hypothetical protein
LLSHAEKDSKSSIFSVRIVDAERSSDDRLDSSRVSTTSNHWAWSGIVVDTSPEAEEGIMFSATSDAGTFAPPRHRDERLELARALFAEFYAQCFWHSPRDLEITEDRIPFVIKGLRANGGHRGFKLAGLLQSIAGE